MIRFVVVAGKAAEHDLIHVQGLLSLLLCLDIA